MIFDSHTHTYPEAIAGKAVIKLGEFYSFTVHGDGTHKQLEEEARQNGIGGFMLFCVATNAHQVPSVNNNIARLTALSRSHGFKAVGFAGMHQDFDDPAGELDRCIGLGLTGVKLHPDIQGIDVDSPRFDALYDALESHGLPLFLHAGDNRPEYRFSAPEKILHLSRRFPSLRIIAAHFGGYRSWEEAEAYLYGNKNIWYDCSSALWAMTPEQAAILFEKCGYDRVFYGSDYPVMHLGDYLELFNRVPLTDRQRELILYENARSFFGLDGIVVDG